MFFGRTEEKKILKERVAAFSSGFRQNIAVLGRPFIGKTSLLQDMLPDMQQYNLVVVYAECREEPFELFCHRFLGALLYQYLKLKNGISQREDLKTLIKNSRKQLPNITQAAENIEGFLKKKDFDAAYDLLLELPKLVHADSGVDCAVIIEEFDKLALYKLTNPFSVLGKKIMAQRNTFYILTSSSVKQARIILSEKLQLLFGNFEVIELGEFDFVSSSDFLSAKLEGFTMPEQYIKFIINFTNGNPFYLDIVASKIKEILLAQKKQRVTAETLEQAFDEIMFDSAGKIYQHFYGLVNAHCRNTNGVDILSILALIAEGSCKTKDITMSLNSSDKSVVSALSHLESVGMVEKMGVFNKIEDPVFRFWLKNVYQKRRMDFTSDNSYRKEIFISNLKKESLDFARSSKEDMYEKIVDLFKSFGNDIIDIDRKRCVLPSFGDVATRVIGENGPYIVCHSKGSNWICQIRERKVTDKHVFDFIKDSKSGKYKFHKKVLIVIEGMDENAKLLAKSSGVWAWNLKTLNRLLDFYEKHKVIKI